MTPNEYNDGAAPDLDWIERRLASVSGLERLAMAALLAVGGVAAISCAIAAGAALAAKVMA
jgi:hypothetical protein